jgi:hypothetical protein
MTKKLIIAVDFDGTCVTHEYPSMGKEIGAPEVLKQLVDRGHKLILFTMRDGEPLQEAVDWFKSHSIPLFGINKNPQQHRWTSSPKVYAQLYIDDAALGTPLVLNENQRPYVDWEAAEKMLKLMDAI